MSRGAQVRVGMFQHFRTQTAGTIIIGTIVQGPASELGRSVHISVSTEQLRQMLAARESKGDTS